MKRNMLNKFLIAGALMLASIIALQSMTVIADDSPDDDEVDGELTSQNYNNRASVIDFDFLQSSTRVEDGSSLDPNTSYTAQVTIKDPDTIRDLNSVKFYFYYEAASPSTPGALTLTQSNVTDNTGSQFVAEWNTTTNAIQVVSSGGTFTWALNSTTAPSVSADFEATEFTFEFEFKMSKVATQTSSSNWFFGTVISDGAESLESGADNELIVDKGLVLTTGSSVSVAPSAWSMNFYGEITLSQSNVSWSGVAAGDGFDAANSSATISGINLISNGDYDTKIKSSALWNAVITQEVVDKFLGGFDAAAVGDFVTEYNNTEGLIDLPTTSVTSALIGATYADANTVINAISGTSVSWASIQFLLPESSDGVNLTGASIVGSNTEINTSGFEEQFFMIGYDKADLTGITEYSGSGFAIVGTDGRAFLPDGNPSQVQTVEAGVDRELNLRLFLSEVFQNAQYKGSLTITITND